MKWYSQSGQDEFAWIRCGDKGTFLDIGCGGPTSNTRALEEMGWTGWQLDIREEALDFTRKCVAIWHDARTMDYSFLPDNVDYFSLDVNGASLDALNALPLDRVRFKCITAEHDVYKHGDKLRKPMREILLSHGYSLYAPDVTDKGLAYEDWYINEAQ